MVCVCPLTKKQLEVGGNSPLGEPPLVAMWALGKNICNTPTHFGGGGGAGCIAFGEVIVLR